MHCSHTLRRNLRQLVQPGPPRSQCCRPGRQVPDTNQRAFLPPSPPMRLVPAPSPQVTWQVIKGPEHSADLLLLCFSLPSSRWAPQVRHLTRLAEGLHEALACDLLSRGDLAWLQPYQPSLSVAWLFQRAMSIPVGQLRQGGSTMGSTMGSTDDSTSSTSGSGTAPAAPASAAPLPQSSPPPPPPPGASFNAIVAATGLRHDAATDAQPQTQQLVAAAARQQRRFERTGGAVAAAAAAEAPRAAVAAPVAPLPPKPSQQQQQQQQQEQQRATPAAAAAGAAGAGGWVDPSHVNELMRVNFGVMRALGDGVLVGGRVLHGIALRCGFSCEGCTLGYMLHCPALHCRGAHAVHALPGAAHSSNFYTTLSPAQQRPALQLKQQPTQHCTLHLALRCPCTCSLFCAEALPLRQLQFPPSGGHHDAHGPQVGPGWSSKLWVGGLGRGAGGLS